VKAVSAVYGERLVWEVMYSCAGECEGKKRRRRKGVRKEKERRGCIN